jgi:hypothetical protein
MDKLKKQVARISDYSKAKGCHGKSVGDRGIKKS